jgi:hypothetical protein
MRIARWYFSMRAQIVDRPAAVLDDIVKYASDSFFICIEPQHDAQRVKDVRVSPLSN